MFKLALVLFLGVYSPTYGGSVRDESSDPFLGAEIPDLEPSVLYAKKAPAPAPVDVNEQVSHALELIGNLVGILGTSVGGLTFELTGVSLHDCTAYFKDKDVSELSCDEFLDDLSECESLGHIKPLLKSAKKRYQKIKGKAASSKNPCRRS